MGDWEAGYDMTFSGNIYNNSIEKYPKPVVDKVTWDPYKKKQSAGLSFVDTMEWNRLTALIGVRHQKEQVEGGYNASATSPSFGLMYKLNNNVSVYGNWMQGLIPGTEVSKNMQIKANISILSRPHSENLALNGIKAIWVVRFPISISISRLHMQTLSPIFMTTMENSRAKVPALRCMEISQKTSSARRHVFHECQNIGGTYDGNRYCGTPKWIGTLAMTYDVTDAFSLNTRLMYNSSAWADNKNTKKIGAWTRLDLGAKYKWTNMKIQ